MSSCEGVANVDTRFTPRALPPRGRAVMVGAGIRVAWIALGTPPPTWPSGSSDAWRTEQSVSLMGVYNELVKVAGSDRVHA